MAAPPPAVLLLVLRVLLLPGAALGNEGGAAGSCECERHREAPILVTRFPDRLQFWEICKELVRFTFKQKRVCGLADAEWVIDFQNSQPAKRRGVDRDPTPTPRVSLSSLTSTGPVAVQDAPGETSGTQPAPDITTAPARALGSTTGSSTLRLGSGAAGAGPGHFPQQAPSVQDHKLAVISLLVVALISVAVAVAVACQRRRTGGGRPLAARVALKDPGEENLFLHREET